MGKPSAVQPQKKIALCFFPMPNKYHNDHSPGKSVQNREPPSGGQNRRQHGLHGLQEVQDGLVLRAAIFGTNVVIVKNQSHSSKKKFCLPIG